MALSGRGPDDVVLASVVDLPEEASPFRLRAADDPPAPVRWREWLAAALLVALADATIYHGRGWAGYALLFAAAPLLLALGTPRLRGSGWALVTAAMLLALAARMVWLGAAWHVAAGFALVAAFAMSLAGLRPYLPEVIVFASTAVFGGYAGLIHYQRAIRRRGVRLERLAWLNAILPLAAFLVFGLLFLLANPDLFSAFGGRLERVLQSLQRWLLEWSPRPAEILFWCAALWIAVGLLRPIVQGPLREALTSSELSRREKSPPGPAPLFAAFRNTLLTVIALFAVYLVFEFRTLWFREFPPGFYYAGYAHQGAAWLTVALALATLMLSLVFRGSVLCDPRLPRLRLLAWTWSLENILLAVAVYHRMLIYVRFNGLTQMRMVGLFGMTAVVIGFLLVLAKIARGRSFLWLVRRQLWALALTVYVYALTPVDALVFQHNTARILAGDLAPAVQISVQSIDAEGIVQLEPLLDCPDDTIRAGVAALLAQRSAEAERLDELRVAAGWTAFQMAERRALARLRLASPRWAEYADPARRSRALAKFHQYVYQWY